MRQVRQAPSRLHPLKTMPGRQHPLTSLMHHPHIPALPSLLEAVPQTTKETLQNPMTVAQQSRQALPCQAQLKVTVMETMVQHSPTSTSGQLIHQAVVMVTFAAYRARKPFIKQKLIWNPTMSDNPVHNIFINGDLTNFRANLCYEARKLRNQGLCEVWTHDGRVLVKDVYNKIHLIKNMSDLDQFKPN